MLTIFTSLKRFEGHSAVIQKNAIKSWLLLRPRPEIILFSTHSNDRAAQDFTNSQNLRLHYSNQHDGNGAALLSDIFLKAHQLASSKILCYMNADIIVTNELMGAINKLDSFKRKFMLVCRRWNIDVEEELTFEPGWEDNLRSRIRQKNSFEGRGAIDVFAFSKGPLEKIPPFVLGSVYWDNWLIYRARVLNLFLVDATNAVTVAHQNHPYSKPRIFDKNNILQEPNAQKNIALGGGLSRIFSLLDVPYRLSHKGVRLIIDYWHIHRYIETLPIFHPWLKLPSKVLLGILAFYRLPAKLKNLILKKRII